MKLWPELQAERKSSIFTQMLYGYQPEADIKTIIENLFPIIWTPKNTTSTLCFQFKNEFPHELIQASLEILFKCLSENLIPYAVKERDGAVTLTKNYSLFSEIKSLFDCAKKDRVIKFRNELTLSIQDLTYFFRVNQERESQLKRLTHTHWRSHYDLKKKPPQIYFTTLGLVQNNQLYDIEFVLSVKRMSRETRVYPTTATLVEHTPREVYLNRFYFSRDILTIVLPKFLTLFIMGFFQKDNLLILAGIILISKKIISNADGYLLKFIQSKYQYKQSFIIKDTPASLLTLFMSIFLGFYNSNNSWIVFFDYFFNNLMIGYHEDKHIRSSQLNAINCIKSIITYYYPDSNLQFRSSYDPFINSRIFTNTKNFFRNILVAPAILFRFSGYGNLIYNSKIYQLTDQSPNVYLELINNKPFINFEDEQLFKAINNVFNFFYVSCSKIHGKYFFIIPYAFTNLNYQNEYYKISLELIEEQYKIYLRLVKLRIDDSFKIAMRISYNPFYYYSAVKLDASLITKEDEAAFDKNFQCKHIEKNTVYFYKLINTTRSIETKKNAITPPPSPKINRNENKNYDHSDKESENFNFQESPTVYQSSLIAKRKKYNMLLEKKARRIVSYLKDKSDTIIIDDTNFRLLRVSMCFVELEGLLKDFDVKKRIINRGRSIDFEYEYFTIKVFAEFKKNKPVIEEKKTQKILLHKKSIPTDLKEKKSPTVKKIDHGIDYDELKTIKKKIWLVDFEKNSNGDLNEIKTFDQIDSSSSIETRSNLLENKIKYTLLISELIENLSKQFYQTMGKYYNFRDPKWSFIYKFIENYIRFSYFSFRAESKVTSRVYGGLPFYIMTRHLMRTDRKPGDVDIVVEKCDPEVFLKKMCEKSEGEIIGFRKTALDLVVYKVKMKNRKPMDVRFTCNDIENDALTLNFPCKAMSFSVDWTEMTPKIRLLTPIISFSFVKNLRYNLLLDFEVIQNQQDLVLLNSSKIRKIFYYILSNIYFDRSKEVRQQIQKFRIDNFYPLEQGLLAQTLSLLHLISDVKRIFQALFLLELIPFRKNLLISTILNNRFSQYLTAARIHYSKNRVNYNQYPFEKVMYIQFSKYIVSSTEVCLPCPPIINQYFKILKEILVFQGNVNKKPVSTYIKYFDNMGEKIITDNLFFNYYQLITSLLTLNLKETKVVDALLIILTLTLTGLFFPKVTIRAISNKSLDPATYRFVYGTTLMTAFKKQLQGISDSFNYVLDSKTIFLQDEPNFKGKELEDVLIHKWNQFNGLIFSNHQNSNLNSQSASTASFTSLR